MPVFVRACGARQTIGRVGIIRIAKAAQAAAAALAIEAAKMHNPELATAFNLDGTQVAASSLPTIQGVSVNFSPLQNMPPAEPQLRKLIAEKVARKEFFYGIELATHAFGNQPTVLDFESLGPMLPLFTSIVWLGQYYWNVSKVTEVPALQLALQLQAKTVTMPHFTCYGLSEDRLIEFSDLNFANVLALRGDQCMPEQDYHHAIDLIAAIRVLRGDTISIGVAGYPDGHPDAKSIEDDMSHLLEKVEAGGDFIITQICFSSDAVKQFIVNARAKGIKVPIVLGVFIPDSMRNLQRIMRIARVSMDAPQLAEYKMHRGNPHAFQEFAQRRAVNMITDVLDSDLGIYGVQFFTANKFKGTTLVLNKLLSRNKTVCTQI